MRLEDPQTIRKLWLGFYVVLAVLVLLDPKLLELLHVIEHDPHHEAHFVVDGLPEFYSVYGFITCVAMVVVSKKLLGWLLMRPDTYYDHGPLDPVRDAKGRPLARTPQSHASAPTTEGSQHDGV